MSKGKGFSFSGILNFRQQQSSLAHDREKLIKMCSSVINSVMTCLAVIHMCDCSINTCISKFIKNKNK